MQIQPNVSPLNNVIGLFLAANPAFQSVLTQHNIDFASNVTASAPSVVLDDPNGHNTQVVFTANANGAFVGTASIHYTRLSAADAASQKTPALSVPMSQADDEASMLLLLAGYAGLNSGEFTLSGVFTRPADVSGNPQTTATLTAKNDSLVYLDGTTLNFTLTWQGQIDLSTANNSNASGFDVTPQASTTQPTN